MTSMRANNALEHLKSLLHELQSLPKETEWVEFKQNKADPGEIGEHISVRVFDTCNGTI